MFPVWPSQPSATVADVRGQRRHARRSTRLAKEPRGPLDLPRASAVGLGPPALTRRRRVTAGRRRRHLSLATVLRPCRVCLAAMIRLVGVGASRGKAMGPAHVMAIRAVIVEVWEDAWWKSYAIHQEAVQSTPQCSMTKDSPA